jgi:hypothetical protein
MWSTQARSAIVERVVKKPIRWGILGIAGWAACWGARSPTGSPSAVAAPAQAETAATPAIAVQSGPDKDRSDLIAWLRSNLPSGGAVVDEAGAPVKIIHTATPDDTYWSIASAYLDFTDTYLTIDLEKALRRNPNATKPEPGESVTIPTLISAVPKSPDEGRLGWPEDRALRGLYIRGGTAQSSLYTAVLSRMQKRNLNLIVLDAKDYDGLLTYKSKVQLAIDSGATKSAPIRNLERTIRFAHSYGVRVAMRVSCFEDEFMVKANPSMAPRATWGRPYMIGWFDPTNEAAQQYIRDLVTESMDAGADEIQLDYIRYPVLGIQGADFDLERRKLTKRIVIRDFVRSVHAMTQARHVPLSLDIFGVVADGKPEDIDMLGQHPATLAAECEALSPMVYPSHYRAGYQGFEIPGNHPEIVGIATKKLLAQLGDKFPNTVVRPWVQAMDYHSPEFGPAYLATEVRTSDKAGGVGWLLWNPGQTYTVAWQALPPVANPTPMVAEGNTSTSPKPRLAP